MPCTLGFFLIPTRPVFPYPSEFSAGPHYLSGYLGTYLLTLHFKWSPHPSVPASRCLLQSRMALPPCLLTYTTCTCTVPLWYIPIMYLLLPAIVYMYLTLELLWRAILQFFWSSLVLHSLPYQIAWAVPCLMLYHTTPCTGHVPLPYIEFLSRILPSLPSPPAGTNTLSQAAIPSHSLILCC
ncbi:hypothetical protein F4680DRAFT_218367 [Xylaria scruposa]|nr:hypothetical protein F4680DRAFT_218367 [Xylaria scruposa]